MLVLELNIIKPKLATLFFILRNIFLFQKLNEYLHKALTSSDQYNQKHDVWHIKSEAFVLFFMFNR